MENHHFSMAKSTILTGPFSQTVKKNTRYIMITHVFNHFFNHQNHPFFGHLTINGGFQAMAESEGHKAT
jgi:hypothetical protein